MGRIPKAEKEKALKSLKTPNNDTNGEVLVNDYSDDDDSSISDSENPNEHLDSDTSKLPPNSAIAPTEQSFISSEIIMENSGDSDSEEVLNRKENLPITDKKTLTIENQIKVSTLINRNFVNILNKAEFNVKSPKAKNDELIDKSDDGKT
jgi:hypothetical protein